ncbi:DMT family transporter [Waterburya agarophytonicola]|uniref:DMT family transporter n=1 Tax=Waterburya agarophytonicola TaxID=2886916 RepID=UPI001E2EE50A|nr:DMT family transporter [Waterburya agarophytonicola]
MNKNSFLTSSKEINEITNSSKQSKTITDIFSWGILAIAVIALAFSPVFTKLSEIEISPTATIFNRLWIATIIMGVWQLIQTPTDFPALNLKEFKFEYKQQGLLILASISATASSVLWAISFTQTSIASSTVLRSLTPLFISLGAWLILKQQFNRQFIIGMTLAIIGGMVIGWDDLHLSTEYLVGDSIAIASAALHGANILTVGYLRDRNCTVSRVLFWRCGFGALIVLPVVWFTDVQLFPITLQGWLMVIALAFVCQTFGQGLLVYSLKKFSSSFVGIVTLLKPIFTAFLAWIIFRETVSLTSGGALLLILLGIYLAKSSSD